MTRKERIKTTLNFEQPDRPPHFEQLFQLTQEAFGMDFPENKDFENMPDCEKNKIFEHTAHLYAKIIEEFNWDAVLVYPPAVPGPYNNPGHAGYEFIGFLKDYLRSYFNEEILIGGFIWGSMICIDTISDYMEFSIKLLERRNEVHEWAQTMYENGLRHAKNLINAGVDFINIGSDHAFNSGTFLSPGDFRELVTPYMIKLTRYIQAQGIWVIMHTDGNLMGIIDQILEIKPDVLHSIDPMAGMNIKEVKRLTYGQVALMGNVQCNYLQEGPAEKIIESSRYCLEHGAPGGGFIFSSSNTIFPGIPLENYRVMLDCLRQV